MNNSEIVFRLVGLDAAVGQEIEPYDDNRLPRFGYELPVDAIAYNVPVAVRNVRQGHRLATIKVIKTEQPGTPIHGRIIAITEIIPHVENLIIRSLEHSVDLYPFEEWLKSLMRETIGYYKIYYTGDNDLRKNVSALHHISGAMSYDQKKQTEVLGITCQMEWWERDPIHRLIGAILILKRNIGYANDMTYASPFVRMEAEKLFEEWSVKIDHVPTLDVSEGGNQ